MTVFVIQHNDQTTLLEEERNLRCRGLKKKKKKKKKEDGSKSLSGFLKCLL